MTTLLGRGCDLVASQTPEQRYIVISWRPVLMNFFAFREPLGPLAPITPALPRGLRAPPRGLCLLEGWASSDFR